MSDVTFSVAREKLLKVLDNAYETYRAKLADPKTTGELATRTSQTGIQEAAEDILLLNLVQSNLPK